jgi:hypothetical protein
MCALATFTNPISVVETPIITTEADRICVDKSPLSVLLPGSDVILLLRLVSNILGASIRGRYAGTAREVGQPAVTVTFKTQYPAKRAGDRKHADSA